MRVMLLENDKRFKLNKGDIFEAVRYRYDPDKISLLQRESDGFEPECNQYKESLAFMICGSWNRIDETGKYVPIDVKHPDRVAI